MHPLAELMVGRSNGATVRGLVLAACLAILGYLGFVAFYLVIGTTYDGSTPFVVTLSLAVAIVAAAFAYLNDGFVVCVLLAVAPFLAWVLHGPALVERYPPAPEGLHLLLVGVATSSIFGLPLGVAGFVLGAGARRVRDRRDRAA